MATAACGSDESAEPDGERVAAACDELEDLSIVVSELPDGMSLEAIGDALAAPLDEFVEAAADSGDAGLAAIADIYRSAVVAFLDGSGAAAQRAVDEADAALDLAGARCIRLGATNDFPQEP